MSRAVSYVVMVVICWMQMYDERSLRASAIRWSIRQCCTLSRKSFSLSSTSFSAAVHTPPLSANAPTVLKCTGLSKSYTGNPQFENIALTLGKGQRVGLIGINGAGKSTLLKCLSGLETADAGTVEIMSGANVVFLEQEPQWRNIKVYEALFEGSSPAAIATRRYCSLLDPTTGNAGTGINSSAGSDDHEASSEDFSDELSQITNAMESSSGWDYQARGTLFAEELNMKPIDSFLFRSVSGLSGGERKRVGLAAALLKQPDVLLLDEVSIVSVSHR